MKLQQHKHLTVKMLIMVTLVLLLHISGSLYAQDPLDWDRRSDRERRGLHGPVHILTEKANSTTVMTTFDLRGYIVEELKVGPGVMNTRKTDTLQVQRREARRRKYDEAGKLVEISESNAEKENPTTEDESLYRKWSIQYDEQGKMTDVVEYSIDFMTNSSSRWEHTTYSYDSSGRPSESVKLRISIMSKSPGKATIYDTTRSTKSYRYRVLPESAGEEAGWIMLVDEVATVPGFVLKDTAGIIRKMVMGPESRPHLEAVADAQGKPLRSFSPNNQQGGYAGSIFSYDSAGNLLTQAVYTYKNYDEYSRSTGQEKERSRYTYEFDSHGNWISQRMKKQSVVDGKYRDENASERIIERTITYYQEGK